MAGLAFGEGGSFRAPGELAGFEVGTEERGFVGAAAGFVIVVDAVGGGGGVQAENLGEVGEEQFGQGAEGDGVVAAHLGVEPIAEAQEGPEG